LLALYAALALEGVRDRSPTADEPLHLMAGYAYNTLDDYRLQPENGNLPQRWAALPLLAESVRLPLDGEAEAWRLTDAPRLQRLFLYGVGNDHAAMLARARAAALVWGLALGLLVFAWARALWGDAAGLLALAFFALSPTMLAHGPLVTSDMCAGFFLLAATGAWWRALRAGGAWAAVGSAVVTGLAALAKFSVVMLPPAFVLLAALALWRRATTPRRVVVLAALHVAIPAAVIWAAFGFRYAPGGAAAPTFAQYYRTWAFTLPEPGLLKTAVETMRAWRVLPEAYLYGFTHVHAASLERSAFLNAEFSTTGWWWFFPYAFLVKTSIGELLLYAAALLAGALAWRRAGAAARGAWLWRVAPLLALLVVYGAFTLSSNLNIGHRHLLPMYAPLLILASGLVATSAATLAGTSGATSSATSEAAPGGGTAAGALRRRVAWPLAGVALLVAGVETVAVRPHYLTFFNQGVGGPREGWHHLVDSSLDWGQDMPRLAAWLREEGRPDEPVYLSVFGPAVAAAYGIAGTEVAPDWPDEVRPWREWTGGLYAVSATRLQGVYNPFHGPWSLEMERILQELGPALRREMSAGVVPPLIDPYVGVGPNTRTLELLQFARLTNYLRLRAPDALIANSIFVFRLTDDEVRVATQGASREYLALLDGAR
jgi:4-amino-4-deoxy-L-arabinose transferase-like glycosyltransferase